MNMRFLINLNRVAGYSIVLMGCLLASEARSQTNVPKLGTISSRFLVIVETSHPMGRRSDATLKTVGSLLYSGFNHEMKQGDSLGLWTFNQQLYAGRLPLQRWSKPLQHEIVSSTLDFLKGQKYEKQPAFASVRPALDKVIKDSESITVIIVSSGEDAMSGTPFDDKINELYKSWKVDQEKAKMPFITVLRAKRGKITGYAAVPAPWQIEMPAWPTEPVAKAAETKSQTAAQPSAVPPSLIFTGKKAKPEMTGSSETTVAKAETAPSKAAPASNTAAPTPADSAVAEPARDPSSIHPGSTPQNAVPERKVEQSTESPQRPAVPSQTVPKDAGALSPTPKPETRSPAVATTLDTTNPAPLTTAQKSTVSPRDISTAVATPANGPLWGRIVWLAGFVLLGTACVALVVLTRRPASEPISLITHSLERESK
jgi:hypothetical protein